MSRPARWLVLAVVLLAAACSDGGGDGAVGTAGPGDEDRATAWVHHGHVTGQLPGNAAAAAVEDADAWRAAWEDRGFEGARPEIDFATHVVLLIGQPDDNCPDELIGLDVVHGTLDVEWLPPGGGCEQPLIFRIHAVEVHRGHLPTDFTVAVDDPYADEFEPVTITLPAFDGDAPPPPEPPQAMTDAEVDAVFEGHAIQRCTDDMFWWLAPHPVDGPLSDDPAVASAQQQRADFGVASDEATVRKLLESPPPSHIEDLGFPLTAEEWELDESASAIAERVPTVLSGPESSEDERYVPLIDRSDGIRPAVIAGAEDAAEITAALDDEFGPGVVTVHVAEHDPADVHAAQRALGGLTVPEPSRITHTSGPPGPATVGLIDPTTEALDLIADAVDPSLVCIEVDRSGLVPRDGG